MSYRQRGFWLRSHYPTRGNYEELTGTNRSIWYESSKTSCTFEDLRSRNDIMVRLVGDHDIGPWGKVWYPNNKPFGVMIFLQIKKVL